MSEFGPTSASELNPSPTAIAITSQAHRQRPLQSLVAAAQRLTSEHVKTRSGFGKAEAWQEDAWEMFDLVGEQRFLTTTLANRCSQARFYVGKVPDNPVEEPEPLENDQSLPARVFAKFGATPAQRAQMVGRQCANLFIAGDGWFAGIPKHLMPGSKVSYLDKPSLKDLSLDDLEWRMLSVSEVTQSMSEVELRLGMDSSEVIKTSPDNVMLIRVWRPHPRRYWLADSPTRSSLPVLRELVGLTMHISAQVDSRLAGAGLLIVPQSARRALQVAAGIPEDSDEDPFTEALIEAMVTPIQDRASASAVVPLVVTVPDEVTEKFHHITFDKPLDNEARGLREEAIRRLALGQDAPPELLLGTAGMNHWGAWLVREDVVTTHIEPPLALICDAVTTQFLWPVLEEMGMPADEAREYVIWYDVGHMVQRPNRLADAMDLYDKGELNGDTLREAGGFTDQDAPEQMSKAVEIAVGIATAHPALIDNLPQIIASLDAVLNPAKTVASVAGVDELTPGQDLEADPEAGAVADADVVGARSGPRDQPAPIARGTDTDRADRTAETTRDPSRPPSGRAVGMAVDTTPLKATTAGWSPLSPSSFSAASSDDDHSDSVCIVAVPSDRDALPGPQEKHVTLVYLGDMLATFSDDEAKVRAFNALGDAIADVASRTAPVGGEVAGVGTLGDEGAVVMFLHSPCMAHLREELMGQSYISQSYEDGDFTKYPRFRPHVTLGYGDEVSEEDRRLADTLTELDFESIELWWGDERVSWDLTGTEEDHEESMDGEPDADAALTASLGQCARCGQPIMPDEPTQQEDGGLVHETCPAKVVP